MVSTNVLSDNQSRNTLTRRAALHGAAACGALALPAGAALAATEPGIYERFTRTTLERPELMRRFAGLPETADPGLAELEAGYARWRAIHAERDRLDAIANELRARIDAAIAPMLPPEPAIPPELAPYSHWNERMGSEQVWYGTVPHKGKIRKIADALMGTEIEWRCAGNKLREAHPDDHRVDEIEAKREQLDEEAGEVRRGVLAIPTRSALGLQIKLAIAMEAKAVDEIEERLANPGWYGVHDGWVSEDLLPVLAADLRAMVGGVA